MTQQAIIRGEVSFRVGDGVMMPIPPGPVEIEVAQDSVTLSWTVNHTANSTAITRDEYERYVAAGQYSRRRRVTAVEPPPSALGSVSLAGGCGLLGRCRTLRGRA